MLFGITPVYLEFDALNLFPKILITLELLDETRAGKPEPQGASCFWTLGAETGAVREKKSRCRSQKKQDLKPPK